MRGRACWRILSDTSTAAAAPQVGGQAIRRVITPGQITWASITSSVVTSLRNSASGLFSAWRLALARILAKASAACRIFSCARGRRRRSSAAPAECRACRPAGRRRRRNASNGLGRSVNTAPSAPGLICSKPSASTQSAAPLRDRLARQEQRGRAGRAVVVDVDDRDAGHADLVQRLLAAGRVAVDVAGIGLLRSWS